MKEGQDKIYYLTADTLAAAKASPHLEAFRKKGVEVLLLADRVDEWLVSNLFEFEGKSLASVAKGQVDLSAIKSEGEDKKNRAQGRRKPSPAGTHQESPGATRQGCARQQPPGRIAGLSGRRRGRHERPTWRAC
jgi:hypothetical protein